MSLLVILCFIIWSEPVFAQYTQKGFDVDLWANGLPNTNGIDHLPFDTIHKTINRH